MLRKQQLRKENGMSELENLKEEVEKNVAMVNYLKGYIKGLEERIVRLEQAN